MKHTWLALALASAGCMTGPTNGSTTSAPVAGKAFTFGGYFNEPDADILLEVLKEPQLDPDVDSNWIGFSITKTGTTAVNINSSSSPLYEWSVSATPVFANPSPTSAKRWPQGGLVRVRAWAYKSNGDRRLLTTFDNITSKCIGDRYVAGDDWQTIGTTCEGLGDNTIALVSTSTLPTPTGGFLTDKGVGNIGETALYYAQIGAPFNLTAFRAAYGFNSDPGTVVSARYFNDGDLGLGRQMNCKPWVSSTGLGVACYVKNYSAVGDEAPNFNETADDVLAQVINNPNGEFATVAMVYQPLVPTKFIVYAANGNLQYEAPLDHAENNKSIPQNCLSCHGIDSTYSTASHNVDSKAEFLPFDPYTYKFSSQSGWTLASQQEAFRKLNVFVKLTSPPAATNELIDGMYAPQSVTTSGATAKNTFVPADWHPNNTLDGEALYNGVVKPYCRTCHVSSNEPTLDFNDYSDFSAHSAQIRGVTCGTKKMPHAERVQKKFWQSGARAYVVTGLQGSVSSYPDLLQACTPN